MPYCEGIVLAILRPALAPHSVFSVDPGIINDAAPCLLITSIGGGGRIDARFSGAWHNVVIDGYHADKRSSYQLVEDALTALVRARESQTVTPDGWINKIEIPSDPDLLSTDEGGLYRYNAVARLLVRS